MDNKNSFNHKTSRHRYVTFDIYPLLCMSDPLYKSTDPLVFNKTAIQSVCLIELYVTNGLPIITANGKLLQERCTAE